MYYLFFIILVVLLFLFVSRLRKVDRQLKDLSHKAEDLYRRLTNLERKAPAAPQAAAEAAVETPLEEPPELAPAGAAAGVWAPPEVTRPSGPQSEPQIKPRPKRRLPKNFEQQIAERWMVWLGGLALALGGAFLVKYTIDQGLLGPKMRILLGLLAALAMIAAGEWVRRKGGVPKTLSRAPDYIPTALTGAGLFTAFATIYAAQALYDLIPAIVAFGLLAAVGFLGLALALLYGPMLAFLGLIGAAAVPLLITLGEANAVTLFSYIFVVTAGSMEILRYRNWPQLAWTALGLSFVWIAFWYVWAGRTEGGMALALFGLGLAALFLYRVCPGRESKPAQAPAARWSDLAGLSTWDLCALAATAVGGFALFVGTRLAGHSAEVLVVVGAFVLAAGLAVRRDARLDIMLAGVAVFVLLLLAVWHVPVPAALPAGSVLSEAEAMILNVRPFVPVEFQFMALSAGGLAAIFLVGGFAGLWGARRPGYWAMISVAAPLAFMAFVYWRIHGFTPSPPWGFFALGVAGFLLLPAGRIAKYRTGAGMNGALGAYAVGVTTALALAFAMMLENAWLTVALAVELPAVAWIWTKLEVRGLRQTALVLAAIVLVRLALNPYTLDYSISGTLPGVNWLLYGYGVPAVAFYLARKLFHTGRESRLQDVLEAGAIIFAFGLVTLEIRSLFSATGAIGGSYEFAERALQTLNWMGFSLVLLKLEGLRRRPFYAWMRHALMAIVVLNLFVIKGPLEALASDVAMGPLPILNLLLLAYAIPAVMAVFVYRAADRIGAELTARIYAVGALGLMFVWLNFEVRHAFHGSYLGRAAASDAESYAYSIAWMAYAGALLAVGLWRKRKSLRYASLAILLLAVLKVFLFDLGQLEGLWRALSFLGLGAVLVGIGYLYRRYVFGGPAPGEASADPAQGPDAVAGEAAAQTPET